jgi:predicted phosphodiesterase
MQQEQHTQQLGNLDGPLLIFGGIYSNLQALQALRVEAERLQLPAQRIICTGDVVAYCADPEACVALVRDWGIHCIAGNVELQLMDGAADCGCNFEDNTRCDLFSKKWYPYVKAQLSATSLAWLAKLPQFLRFRYAEQDVLVLHGSYEATAAFIFRSTPWTTKARQFQLAKADLILAGHCGLPFRETRKGKQWLNAGVIGMPANDGNPEVWYLTLRAEGKKVVPNFHALAYDFQTAATRLEAANLPPAYAQTLRTGIWDNCDILPSTESQQQGQPLVFNFPSDLPKV